MIFNSMRVFILLGFALVVAVLSSSVHGNNAFALYDAPPKARRCLYSKPHQILEAQCRDLHLTEIPPTLQKSIEALDISTNRLRELTDKTLAPFTSLAYLDLRDNIIINVDDNAFSPLQNLEVLDITLNGLNEFPKNLLSLPKLKRIFIGRNNLGDSAFNHISHAEESNVESFDLSKNHLTKLPNIGYMSRLKYLNVSGNKIESITAKDVAMLCSLQMIDISYNPIIGSCDCHELNAWIDYRKIKVIPDKLECQHCSISADKNVITNETLKIYENCQAVISTREERAKMRTIWIIISIGIGVLLSCLTIFFSCIHKRSKKKKLQGAINKELMMKNVDEKLLDSRHIPEQI